MPELPDVEHFRMQAAHSGILWMPIGRTEVRDPSILRDVSQQKLAKAVKSRPFTSTQRHGKALFLRIKKNGVVVFHFGMTGRLHIVKGGDDMSEHAHVIFHTKEKSLAFVCPRKFGHISLAESVQEYVVEQELGDDARCVTRERFMEVLEGSGKSLKSLLMDQHRIAGIGNIYADEILFKAGMHPRMRASDLSGPQKDTLFHAMRSVLEEAIHAGAAAENMPEAYLIRHRSNEGICPRDGSRLDRFEVNGRTTYICPEHQQEE